MNKDVKKALSYEAFMLFFLALKLLRFQKLSRQQILSHLRGYTGFRSLKKKSEGMETGYVYRFKNKMMIIWSTYSERLVGPKKHDEGWIVIIDYRSPTIFYTHPLRRTATFLTRILESAEAYQELLQQWPVCPVCKSDLFLDIIFDENKSKSYIFSSHHRHSKEYRVAITDVAISTDNQKIIAEPFLRNKLYRKHNPDRVPQQMIRYAIKNGAPCLKKLPPYNDLVHEKHEQDFIDPPHDDSEVYYD